MKDKLHYNRYTKYELHYNRYTKYYRRHRNQWRHTTMTPHYYDAIPLNTVYNTVGLINTKKNGGNSIIVEYSVTL